MKLHVEITKRPTRIGATNTCACGEIIQVRMIVAQLNRWIDHDVMCPECAVIAKNIPRVKGKSKGFRGVLELAEGESGYPLFKPPK